MDTYGGSIPSTYGICLVHRHAINVKQNTTFSRNYFKQKKERKNPVTDERAQCGDFGLV